MLPILHFIILCRLLFAHAILDVYCLGSHFLLIFYLDKCDHFNFKFFVQFPLVLEEALEHVQASVAKEIVLRLGKIA